MGVCPQERKDILNMFLEEKKFVATRNPCKLCTPLGASAVFKGLEGCVSLLHGSQGCSTYIRRYFINHFKEPVDIASTNFSEATAVFGGKENLFQALRNINHSYKPNMIGLSTTCLSETIGDDVKMFLHEFKKTHPRFPDVVHVSTPSYAGAHMDGFHDAVNEVVKHFSRGGPKKDRVALFPNFVSPVDIRHLKEITGDFGLSATLVPDYSDTLDGGVWKQYESIPAGGTPVNELREMGRYSAAVELGHSLFRRETAAKHLLDEFGVKRINCGLPIGIKLTDQFLRVLEELSGSPVPEKYVQQRGRLIDSYSDAHKYIFKKKAIVYGDEDLVMSLTQFLLEIGIAPILCATGSKCDVIEGVISSMVHEHNEDIKVRRNADFMSIADEIKEGEADFLIGNSKGYPIARKYNIPLIRVGFPIHDRVGAARIRHIGYEGTQQIFDRIVNTLIEKKQEASSVGYMYL